MRPPKAKQKVTLMGSGASLAEVVKAAQPLADEGIEAGAFSVTSLSELACDGLACEQRAIAGEEPGESFFAQQLGKGSKGPIAAPPTTCAPCPRAYAFLPEGRRYLAFGIDDFGRSETQAALCGFFGVDAASIARATRYAVS